MKKNLFIAAAACVALAACTKNEVKPVEMDQEITFQTINTKAASAFSTSHKFYSWAYILASGQTWAAKSATSSPYITNSLIEYSSNAWKNASTSYYWPKNAGLTFFAWSDATNDPKVTSPATVACSKDGGIKFDNFDTSVDKKKDLLVAKIAADQTSNTSAHDSWAQGVPVVFYHVLSAMELTAKTNVDYGTTKFKVKSVVFNDVLCKGTYTQGVDATKTPIQSAWNTVADKSTFDVYSPTSPSSELNYTDATPLNAQPNDVRIFMPQTLPDGAKVTVTYQVTYGDTGITDEVTIKKDLKNIFTEWKPGYKYTLNIVIGLDEVLWDPDIQPWENGTGNVTI